MLKVDFAQKELQLVYYSEHFQMLLSKAGHALTQFWMINQKNEGIISPLKTDPFSEPFLLYIPEILIAKVIPENDLYI